MSAQEVEHFAWLTRSRGLDRGHSPSNQSISQHRFFHGWYWFLRGTPGYAHRQTAWQLVTSTMNNTQRTLSGQQQSETLFHSSFLSNLPSGRDWYQHWRVNTRQQCPFGSAAAEEQRTMLLHKMLKILLLEQHAKFKIMAITLSILDRFAKFFQYCKQHKIFNKNHVYCHILHKYRGFIFDLTQTIFQAVQNLWPFHYHMYANGT